MWQFSASSIGKMIDAAVQFRRFPLFSMWGAIFDRLAIQMPIFMLSKYFATESTGQFSLTFRVMNVPLSLVGVSVSQVLFQKVVELYNRDSPELRVFAIKIFILLLLPMVPMILIFWFWGEEIFAFIFGSQWAFAGEIASVLCIAAAVRFAVSPLSMILAMDHNLKLGTLWQFLYLVTLTVTLLWAKQFDLMDFVSIFVAHEVVLYLIYFAFILKGTTIKTAESR